MPSIAISTLLLYILTQRWGDEHYLLSPLYDDPECQNALAIIRPSTLESDPVPEGLSASDSRTLARFIDVVINIADNKRILLLKQAPGEPDFSEALHIWKSYYRRKLGARVIKLVEDVLQEHGAHPMQVILETPRDTWPCVSTLVRRNVEIGAAVFGPNAMLGSQQLQTGLTEQVRVLITLQHARLKKMGDRAWERLFGPKGGKGSGIWPGLLRTFNQLESAETFSSDLLNDTMAVVRNHRNLKAIKMYPTTRKRYLEFEAQVKGLLEQLGCDTAIFDADEEEYCNLEKASLSVEDERKNREKGAELAGRVLFKGKPGHLADEDDVREAFRTLVGYFEERSQDNTAPLLDDIKSLPQTRQLAELILQGDRGVDKYRGHSQYNMEFLLGRSDGKTKGEEQLFNRFIATRPEVNAWKGAYKGHHMFNSGSRAAIDDSFDLVPLKPKWHQDVFLCSAVELFWVEKGEKSKRFLLADDVGLGKTFEVISLLAFILKVYKSEEVGGLGRPPIVSQEGHQYFAGLDRIPNRPHLLIVPNAVIAQWTTEIYRFLKKGTFDLFFPPSNPAGAEVFFMDPTCDWKRSTRPMHERIVVLTHSQIANFASANFSTHKSLGGTPFDEGRKALKTSKCKEFWEIRWALVAIDESHQFRVPTNKGAIGVMEVVNRSDANCLISGTPLQTSHRDLFVAGRHMMVDKLLGEGGRLFELQGNNAICKAKGKDNAQKAGGKWDSDNAHSSFEEEAKLELIRSIQKEFGPRIIRRTLDSLDNDGKPISPMIHSTYLSYYASLSPTAYKRYEEAALADSESHTLQHDNSSFYIHARKAIDAPLLPGAKPDDFPVFKTEAEFDNYDGAKLKHLVKLVSHILADDRADLPYLGPDKENMVYPELPPVLDGEERPRTVNVLVYSQFCMTMKTILSAFSVKGIYPFCIDGAMTAAQRNKEIDAWQNNADPQRRVLIFTSVGSTGCNFQKASVIIHFSQNWSGNQDKQIDGRVKRLGQTRVVIIIHMLLLGTIDIIMSRMANAKTGLLSGALERSTEDLMKVLKNADLVDDDEVEESSDHSQKPAPMKRRIPKDSSAMEPKAKRSRKSQRMEKAKQEEVPQVSMDLNQNVLEANALALEDNEKGQRVDREANELCGEVVDEVIVTEKDYHKHEMGQKVEEGQIREQEVENQEIWHDWMHPFDRVPDNIPQWEVWTDLQQASQMPDSFLDVDLAQGKSSRPSQKPDPSPDLDLGLDTDFAGYKPDDTVGWFAPEYLPDSTSTSSTSCITPSSLILTSHGDDLGVNPPRHSHEKNATSPPNSQVDMDKVSEASDTILSTLSQLSATHLEAPDRPIKPVPTKRKLPSASNNDTSMMDSGKESSFLQRLTSDLRSVLILTQNMSTTTTTAITDAIPSTVPKLDPSGVNWQTFMLRFMDAIQGKGYWGHFNGTEMCSLPTGPPAKSEEADTSSPSGTTIPSSTPSTTEEDKKAMDKWDRDEAIAQSLLTQPL
ncbi:hypothetical protein CVT24_000951 [Panaeolus cyanescens]|uniref:Helicase C-terminal domain-containing protein n=1 Tax=Panaeolus cyanescens TaxID=181874 RepID=A0A409YCI8_9AGAR|nr:hypothetical protein CVT24_000951 [Panaeolus cyanescens]